MSSFPATLPQTIAQNRVVVTQGQDLAPHPFAPHTIGLSPSIQSVQISLQSLAALQQIKAPAQLGVACKLTESTLDSLVQIIDKDTKQGWPQNWILRSITFDWPPDGCSTIHHQFGPSDLSIFTQ
ncbi:hypothetical protein DUI87_16071 [Hirundo rustica rustica]|uniref:Uncharacterized protein n=1 Tax=Hirundo rustica rustica TaxID=333673 RepID=A0A3M0K0D8_HIRRU|nr:hypothetical protein DUI87_16071 [Hirundo rustica rustica]